MRLIDMDTLWQCETCFHHMSGSCDTWCDAGEAYRPAASKLKAIDPESLRPKGEWIEHVGSVECGKCHRLLPFAENFCPNCGADMRGET